ncbi:MAG: aminopeptidase P family protein [Alphaproteobacteria bacterium]|nr:aminopeptidase P family protein [Alphaproteobacteria bacterium]
MALHFTREEFAARQAAAIAAMAGAGLDGLLMFRQESMYYLTGYDTFGYCFFQCLYLGADGRMVLLTRAPDLRQAQLTSTIGDIRIWVDREGATPEHELRGVLAELGAGGRALGIELEAYGLTGANWDRVRCGLDGFCRLKDASHLVSRLRVVKSPAELAYVRRAAALGDAALVEANRLATPGGDEGEILAAMQGAVFRGGGDYPGNSFIIGLGEGALLCCYFSGRRRLAASDQLMLEFAGVYRQYHSALMRTIVVGRPSPRQREMYAVCREALEGCIDAVRPGETMATVYDRHAAVFGRAGFGAHRLNACGYSLGTTYAPTWMDWPMFYRDNPIPMQAGMVLFLHMILMDSDNGYGMALGTTVTVTERGCGRLSQATLDLVVN